LSQLSTCTQNSDTLTVSAAIYASTDCTGYSIPQTFDKLPTSCINGTKLSCQDTPVAVDSGWPALGLYVEDSTCAKPTALIAMKPGCTDVEMLGISTEVSCSAESGFSLQAYNNSLTCAGTSDSHMDIQLDQCWYLNTSTPIPPELDSNPLFDQLNEFLNSNYIDLSRSSFYYYADCGGAENIPGVETSSTPSSNGDDDNDYGGLGVVEFSLIIVFSVIVGVLCCVCGVKRLVLDKKRTEADMTTSILKV
jgi:hypothetical protein